MGVTGRILLQKALQAACQVLDTGKTATGHKATVQHPEEQLGLLEPRAVFRRAMKHRRVAAIAQKSSALRSFFALGGLKRHLAPARDQAAHVPAPVGIEVVHPPIITLHTGPALGSLLEMG